MPIEINEMFVPKDGEELSPAMQAYLSPEPDEPEQDLTGVSPLMQQYFNNLKTTNINRNGT